MYRVYFRVFTSLSKVYGAKRSLKEERPVAEQIKRKQSR